MSKLRRAIVSPIVKTLLSMVCKIDCAEFKQIFENARKANGGNIGGTGGANNADGSGETGSGPMIIALNHINFLEVPLLVSFGHPERITGLVQAGAWKNPLMGYFFDSYDGIPLDREGSYLGTFRRVHDMMKRGFYMCIAPEGHRSGDGILREAKAGIVQLALITGAPIVPIAHFGGQNFWRNFKRLKRTPITVRAGKPFRIKTQNGRPDKEERKIILDEVMGQIARLLPQELRGEYTQSALKTPKYLEFLD